MEVEGAKPCAEAAPKCQTHLEAIPGVSGGQVCNGYVTLSLATFVALWKHPEWF